MSRRASRSLQLAIVGILVVAVMELVGPAPTSAAPESGSSDWRMISAGGVHSCGIRTSGRLYCWGSDQYGQLGDGGTNTSHLTPVEVARGSTDWTTVGAGLLHTCARRATGRLYCWGRDDFGQLGDGGTATDRVTPHQVTGNRTDWAALSTGSLHGCARRTSGRLYCWGYDGFGQLGNGPANTDAPAPSPVIGNRTDWAAVGAGGNHTCARRTSGRLFCWGFNNYGQVGDGTAGNNRSSPRPVLGGHTDWTTFSTGGAHTCGRRRSGRLYCWGLDDGGQIGDGGTNLNQPDPTEVVGHRTDWTSVSSGSNHTCARRRSGRLYCWGDDFVGQLGNGDPAADLSSPSQVQGGATDWTAISAGRFHTCALITSRRAFCWGYNLDGQVGDGSLDSPKTTPVPVEA